MILVTGATGNVGSALIQRLAAAEIPSKALVRSEEKAQQLAAANVEAVIGDMGQIAQMEAALEGVSKLFLLSPLDPTMPALQQQVIELAKQTGVQQVVKLSVENADAQSNLSVNRWHGEVEQFLAASGLAWTNLQPGYFMQNLLMSAPTIRAQNSFFAPRDEMTAAIDARDIAAAAFSVLTSSGHENKTYQLTGGEAISYTEMMEQLSQVLDRQIQLVQIPQSDYRQGLVDAGMPNWLVDSLMEMVNAPLQTPRIETTTSVLTGRSPILFRQFATDYAEHFVKNDE